MGPHTLRLQYPGMLLWGLGLESCARHPGTCCRDLTATCVARHHPTGSALFAFLDRVTDCFVASPLARLAMTAICELAWQQLLAW
jgi:hypothetical protein